MNQSIWIFLREHTKDIIEKQTADLTKYQTKNFIGDFTVEQIREF